MVGTVALDAGDAGHPGERGAHGARGAASLLKAHAAWVLAAAHGLSAAYELWRATVKAGISRYDSLASFLRQDVPLYVIAAVVIALLFLGVAGSAWIGLAFATVGILASALYYSPKVLVAREPGPIDWLEVLVFTGLLFVAAALLLYEVRGLSLGG